MKDKIQILNLRGLSIAEAQQKINVLKQKNVVLEAIHLHLLEKLEKMEKQQKK